MITIVAAMAGYNSMNVGVRRSRGTQSEIEFKKKRDLIVILPAQSLLWFDYSIPTCQFLVSELDVCMPLIGRFHF